MFFSTSENENPELYKPRGRSASENENPPGKICNKRGKVCNVADLPGEGKQCCKSSGGKVCNVADLPGGRSARVRSAIQQPHLFFFLIGISHIIKKKMSGKVEGSSTTNYFWQSGTFCPPSTEKLAKIQWQMDPFRRIWETPQCKMTLICGRTNNTPRSERKGLFCYTDIEDEFHFVLICPVYIDLRKIHQEILLGKTVFF